MTDQTLPAVQQDNLLAILVTDTTRCWLVRGAVNPEDFSGAVHRTIASRVYEFLDQFRKPPREHLPELLEKELSQSDRAQAALYAQVVEGLPRVAETLNAEYVITQLSSWVRRQRLMSGVIRAHKEVDAGRLEEAESVLLEAMRHRLSVFEPGLTLVQGLEWLREHRANDEEQTLPTGIAELDKRHLGPTRKELHLMVAAPGRGKSWWAVHAGRQALRHRWRVVHVTLEMSAPRVVARYLQSLFSLTQRQVERLRIAKFMRDEMGRLTGFDEEELARACIADPKTQREIAGKLKRLRFAENVRVKEFPSGTLTVPMLRAYLDGLEQTQRFVPDLLIVDYADLMRVDPRYRREELGTLYVDLRGMASERNIAVVTASQSNREGAQSKVVRDVHVAEDWSKIMSADTVLTYNQTEEEKKRGLARLYVGKARNEESGFALLLSQAYPIGQFALDSIWMSENYWRLLEE